MGESYVVRNDGTWINPNTKAKSYDVVVGDEMSPYKQMVLKRNSLRINLFETLPRPRGDEIWCKNCKQRMLPIDRDRLFAIYQDNEDLINMSKIKQSKADGFMFCRFCGNWVEEPTYEVAPNSDVIKSSVCWQPDCMSRTK